jgi:hypothetical protein
LLARSTPTREFAIRSALGASPARIRQIAYGERYPRIAGGALGLLIAKLAMRVILKDWRMLFHAPTKSRRFRAALYCRDFHSHRGLRLWSSAPAIKMLRPKLRKRWKEGGRGSSGARHRTQSVLLF